MLWGDIQSIRDWKPHRKLPSLTRIFTLRGFGLKLTNYPREGGLDGGDTIASQDPRGAVSKQRRHAMSVARVTEITSQSARSFEDAIRQGIRRANETLRNVSGAWVKEQQVAVEAGKITGYRVNMLVTFVLEDAPRGRAAAKAAGPAPVMPSAPKKATLAATKAARKKSARRRR